MHFKLCSYLHNLLHYIYLGIFPSKTSVLDIKTLTEILFLENLVKLRGERETEFIARLAKQSLHELIEV